MSSLHEKLVSGRFLGFCGEVRKYRIVPNNRRSAMLHGSFIILRRNARIIFQWIYVK
jgi:hypothetical protein